MSRKLIRVPSNWGHPKDENGNYIPLFTDSFSKDLENYENKYKQWLNGFRDDWKGGWVVKSGKEITMSFDEWYGEKPKKEHYITKWDDVIKPHIQLYETTTEGTPITPIYNINELEKLCNYASVNRTSFGKFKNTKEE